MKKFLVLFLLASQLAFGGFPGSFPADVGNPSYDAVTVTGVAGIANGTVSAPSLAFTSDTNTGLYRIGADNYGLAAGGVLGLSATATAVASALPITITASAGPHLIVVDGGTFGTNADPKIRYVDGAATTGAEIGYLTAAGNDFSINQTITAGALLLSHDEVTQQTINASGTQLANAVIRTPEVVALVGDNQAVSLAGVSTIHMTSDDGTGANRTFTLASCVSGNEVTIFWNDTDEGELADTGTQLLSAAWVPTAIGEMLVLHCDGTNVVEKYRRAAP